jgi:hypothetical protein
MHECDLLAGPLGGDELGGYLALLVITTDETEDPGKALLGQQRVGGGGRNVEHVVRLVDGRGGDRRARAEVAGDEHDPVRDQLAGDRNALLGVAVVVPLHDPHLLAQHAAPRIQLRDGGLNPEQQLLAVPGVGAGDRPCGPDPYLRTSRPYRDRGGRGEERHRGEENDGPDPHGTAP